MGLVVLAKFLLAPAFGTADVIVAFLETDRGHANFGKRKMVRTIERALLRPRVRRDAVAPFARDRPDDCIQRRTLCAERHKIIRWAQDVHGIEIDIRGGLRNRY